MNVLRLSSDMVPSTNRLHVVQDLYASMVHSHVDMIADVPWFIESTIRPLPGVNVARNACHGCTLSRSRRHIVEDGNDDLMLCIVMEGEMLATPRGGDPTLLRRGDVYFQSNDIPTVRRFLKPTFFMDVGIVRGLFEGSFAASLHRLLQQKIGTTARSELRLLADYARMVTGDSPPMLGPTASVAATHLQDLALLALGPPGDADALAPWSDVRAVRLSAVKADVIARATDDDLNIDAVAARQGISPQYVRELFRSDGTTFTDFLRSERLKHAYRKLTDNRYARWTITAIALACGFSDLSYFNRCFRRHYGMTPSDARQLGDAASKRPTAPMSKPSPSGFPQSS